MKPQHVHIADFYVLHVSYVNAQWLHLLMWTAFLWVICDVNERNMDHWMIQSGWYFSVLLHRPVQSRYQHNHCAHIVIRTGSGWATIPLVNTDHLQTHRSDFSSEAYSYWHCRHLRWAYGRLAAGDQRWCKYLLFFHFSFLSHITLCFCFFCLIVEKVIPNNPHVFDHNVRCAWFS